MKIGISSSCFYPEDVELGFEKVGRLGVETSELFINSPCELRPPLIDELKRIQEYYGLEIRSLHPFTSAFESFFFFSAYDRRRLDGVEMYKRYFDAANRFGAEAVVFHGGNERLEADADFYAECYSPLHEAAREQGIYLAHENVTKFRCASPQFMKALADRIGDEFRMVLDIKQCRRSGESEFDFIELLGDKIIQVHISDFDRTSDCLAPGAGVYDFKKLFTALKTAGYDKTALIELYSRNYKGCDELKTAVDFLKSQI